ncbi:MAG: sulfatase-like hydrolase/transferase [Verrucomicrobiales bacterium]
MKQIGRFGLLMLLGFLGGNGVTFALETACANVDNITKNLSLNCVSFKGQLYKANLDAVHNPGSNVDKWTLGSYSRLEGNGVAFADQAACAILIPQTMKLDLLCVSLGEGGDKYTAQLDQYSVKGLWQLSTYKLLDNSEPLPNIITIITDDTGIDQFRIFGYGGAPDEQAKTPNIDALGRAGVRFRNTWSTPTCGPSRASILTGRYNLRNNVLSAPAPPDLPNSQPSPYEYMIPSILKNKNYVSAAIGKVHLSTHPSDPGNLPYMNETIRKLGFDYFEGYLAGAPSPVDTTAGGIGVEGTYSCGFVPSLADSKATGADYGACYFASGSCNEISTQSYHTPGRSCLEQGGIFVPNASCGAMPSALNFNTQNGHYTGNWVINEEDGITTRTQPPSDERARGFKTQQEVDRAISWINKQSGDNPWMLTLGLTAIHEPVQQSPVDLVSSDSPLTGGYDCLSNEAQRRELATQMVEAIDHEVGRLMVETKLATYNSDGTLNYQPETTNTYVVFTSDNGTWTTSVREPFDPIRAKGTVYQTGVWVPLIIAGPNVRSPDREVDHMVNLVDLFTFFGEVAGLDVRAKVPEYRELDSNKLMPYLLNPEQEAIRTTNYTIQGNNIRSSSSVSYPCVVESLEMCTYSLPAKQVCIDQSGKWYGPDGEVTEEPGYYTSCCQVKQATGHDYLAAPTSTGIRNKDYKLVQHVSENCQNGVVVEPPAVKEEFYQINENVNNPQLDTADKDLLRGELTASQNDSYQSLKDSLAKIEGSVVACPGDGNMDKVVDQTDLDEWAKFAETTPGLTTGNAGGMGSWYDFGGPDDWSRPDGITDHTDEAIINANLGTHCK